VKFAIVPCCAVVILGCSAANAAAPEILSPLGSKADNLLIGRLAARNPGTLCAIVRSDGHARLVPRWR
jgi:hypothetical protein